MVLVEVFEEFLGMAELRLVSRVQTDDDAVQVFDLGQLRQDVRHRIALQLGIEAGQDQRDFARLPEHGQLVLHLLQRSCAQVVQGGDVSVLVKVGHVQILLQVKSLK